MVNKSMGIASKIIVGLVLGIVFGFILNLTMPKPVITEIVRWVLNPLGKIFVNGITMVVVPLVVVSIISGMSSIGDLRKLGRVGGKIVAYYLVTTAIAVTLGLIAGNIIQPGLGLDITPGTPLKANTPPFIMDTIVNMIPSNALKSMVDTHMLGILSFSIIFGLCLASLGEKGKTLANVIEQVNEVMIQIMRVVMMIAPYAVFALISKTIAEQGTKVLISLSKYVIAVVIALIIQLFFTYGGALFVFTRLSIIQFLKRFWPAMAVAFSTCSSNGTLPVTLDTCEKRLGIPKSIGSFTLPLGATVNMDGTAILQGVAIIFIAGASGVTLTVQQMLTVVLTATLASIGAAGVPGTALLMLTLVTTAVGLPVEIIPILWSVDRILDMCRTTINVTGDAIGTTIIAQSEGELDLEKWNKGKVSYNV